MILEAVIFSFFLQLVSCAYQPGDAGAPWSEEEIDIVRDKVQYIIPYRNSHVGVGGKYTYCAHWTHFLFNN